MILLNVKLLLKAYFLKYGFVGWSEGIEPSTRTFFSYLNLPSPVGVLPLAQDPSALSSELAEWLYREKAISSRHRLMIRITSD